MKTFSILFILLVSSKVFACPQLSGVYTCDWGEGPEVLQIIQTNSSGVEIYYIDGTELVADGKPKSYSDPSFVGDVATGCNSDTLEIATIGDLLENGVKTSSVSLTTSYLLTNEGLVETTNGIVEYQGEVYPVNEMVVCTPN